MVRERNKLVGSWGLLLVENKRMSAQVDNIAIERAGTIQG